MRVPSIAIYANSREYNKLIILGNHVYENMLLNSYFPNPNPSMPILRNSIDRVVEYKGLWGSKSNRGSHEDLLQLRYRSLVLHQDLKSLQNYVLNRAAELAGIDFGMMTSILNTSGYSIVGARKPHGGLEPVRNLRNYMSRSLNINQALIKWSRPLNTSASRDVDMYELYLNTELNFTKARSIGLVRTTSFLLTNTTSAPVLWYIWVVPYNAVKGAVSAPLMIRLFNA